MSAHSGTCLDVLTSSACPHTCADRRLRAPTWRSPSVPTSGAFFKIDTVTKPASSAGSHTQHIPLPRPRSVSVSIHLCLYLSLALSLSLSLPPTLSGHQASLGLTAQGGLSWPELHPPPHPFLPCSHSWLLPPITCLRSPESDSPEVSYCRMPVTTLSELSAPPALPPPHPLPWSQLHQETVPGLLQ